MNHYDAILGLVPLALGGSLLSIGEPAIGAVVAGLAIAYGMFVRPPTALSTLHPKE